MLLSTRFRWMIHRVGCRSIVEGSAECWRDSTEPTTDTHRAYAPSAGNRSPCLSVCPYLTSFPLAAEQSWRAKKIAGRTTPGVAEAVDVDISVRRQKRICWVKDLPERVGPIEHH